jgi:WD40 repeat protein
MWQLARRHTDSCKLKGQLEEISPGWAPAGAWRDAGDWASSPGSCIALSHDGKWLANACGQFVLIWCVPGGRVRPVFALPEDIGLVWSLAWHPERDVLAVGTSAGMVSMWDMDKIQDNLRELGLQLE